MERRYKGRLPAHFFQLCSCSVVLQEPSRLGVNRIAATCLKLKFDKSVS